MTANQPISLNKEAHTVLELLSLIKQEILLIKQPCAYQISPTLQTISQMKENIHKNICQPLKYAIDRTAMIVHQSVDGIDDICPEISKYVLALTMSARIIGCTLNETVNKALTHAIIHLFQCISKLFLIIHNLKNSKKKCQRNSKSMTDKNVNHAIGCIWQALKDLQNIALDNKIWIARKILSSLALIRDAKKEFLESIKELESNGVNHILNIDPFAYYSQEQKQRNFNENENINHCIKSETIDGQIIDDDHKNGENENEDHIAIKTRENIADNGSVSSTILSVIDQKINDNEMRDETSNDSELMLLDMLFGLNFNENTDTAHLQLNKNQSLKMSSIYQLLIITDDCIQHSYLFVLKFNDFEKCDELFRMLNSILLIPSFIDEICSIAYLTQYFTGEEEIEEQQLLLKSNVRLLTKNLTSVMDISKLNETKHKTFQKVHKIIDYF